MPTARGRGIFGGAPKRLFPAISGEPETAWKLDFQAVCGDLRRFAAICGDSRQFPAVDFRRAKTHISAWANLGAEPTLASPTRANSALSAFSLGLQGACRLHESGIRPNGPAAIWKPWCSCVARMVIWAGSPEVALNRLISPEAPYVVRHASLGLPRPPPCTQLKVSGGGGPLGHPPTRGAASGDNARRMPAKIATECCK